jgi:hypothetical protein
MAKIVVGSSNLTQPLLLYLDLGPAMLEQYRRNYRAFREIKVIAWSAAFQSLH